MLFKMVASFLGCQVFGAFAFDLDVKSGNYQLIVGATENLCVQ